MRRDWQRIVDEGLVVPYEDAQPLAKEHIREGWDCCIRARKYYSDAEYDKIDREIRQALLIAAESLCYYENLRPAEPASLDLTERLCREFWGEQFAAHIFDRAYLLGGMLPLPREPLPEEQAKLVRRSISASTEFVALVECSVFM